MMDEKMAEMNIDITNVIEQAIEKIRNEGYTVQKWIPCSERLPEVYEKVLTYNDEGIIHDNFRLNLRDGSVGWSQGWGITHWQPRPEPPEKE
jgi:hypothetical protein